MTLTVRPLQAGDFTAWLPLWDANNLGQRDEKVTKETWKRLIDPASAVNGFCAVEHGALIGLVHYIVHPTTGSVNPVCYMQDVYVDPKHRRKGIARAMVEKLTETGKNRSWGRIYWLAESGNEAAQALYKSLGVKLDFTLHVLPLGKV